MTEQQRAEISALINQFLLNHTNTVTMAPVAAGGALLELPDVATQNMVQDPFIITLQDFTHTYIEPAEVSLHDFRTAFTTLVQSLSELALERESTFDVAIPLALLCTLGTVLSAYLLLLIASLTVALIFGFVGLAAVVSIIKEGSPDDSQALVDELRNIAPAVA